MGKPKEFSRYLALEGWSFPNRCDKWIKRWHRPKPCGGLVCPCCQPSRSNGWVLCPPSSPLPSAARIPTRSRFTDTRDRTRFGLAVMADVSRRDRGGSTWGSPLWAPDNSSKQLTGVRDVSAAVGTERRSGGPSATCSATGAAPPGHTRALGASGHALLSRPADMAQSAARAVLRPSPPRDPHLPAARGDVSAALARSDGSLWGTRPLMCGPARAPGVSL